MSDFIFSINNIEPNKITKAIQSIYHQDKPIVQEFHGHWGSLGISRNLYHGFDPYENEQSIVVVIGGPILTFRENDFLNDKDSFEGTKSIFERWQSGEMKWDNDLSGPFSVIIINKLKREVTCITDLMSFIPVYSYKSDNKIVLSTHVDALARITEQYNDLDEVSLVDFILHGVVTYPYTSYLNIYQIAPAAEHRILQVSVSLKCNSYWSPIEENKYKSVNEAVYDLRNGLQSYTDKITSQTTNIAQFISGGEDSRMLSGLLSNYPRDAYIFLDQMNREGKIAKNVANKYEANFKLATRSELHYLNILPSCSDLVGSGSQYHHAHTYGFHNSCNLFSYTAVFGGMLSDALLKGSHIKKVRRTGKLPLIPEIKKTDYSAGNQLTNFIFTTSVLTELTDRRRSHLNYVKKFRSESAEEWFELWPSSMNANIPNVHANRRLFRSYEPFTSKDVVKISASVPQKWKLNRKLFYPTAKRFLKPSKWLFHGDGWLPYFPWYINNFIRFTIWVYRQIGRKVGFIKGNQGPWGEWNIVINSPEWKQALANYFNKVDQKSDEFSELLKELEVYGKLSNHQYVNLTQVLYQIGNNRN